MLGKQQQLDLNNLVMTVHLVLLCKILRAIASWVLGAIPRWLISRGCVWELLYPCSCPIPRYGRKKEKIKPCNLWKGDSGDPKWAFNRLCLVHVQASVQGFQCLIAHARREEFVKSHSKLTILHISIRVLWRSFIASLWAARKATRAQQSVSAQQLTDQKYKETHLDWHLWQ